MDENQKDGRGVQIWPDGSRYDGFWRDGMAMDMEDSFMQRVMCMKENGLKTKLMAMEYIRILMEVDTRVNGSKISNMDLVLSNGLMALSTRDSTSKE